MFERAPAGGASGFSERLGHNTAASERNVPIPRREQQAAASKAGDRALKR